MRRKRSGVAGILLVALAIGACGGDGATTTTELPGTTTTRASTTFGSTPLDPITTTSTRPPTTTTAPPSVTPRPGGSVIVGERFEPATLNPLVEDSAAVMRIGQLHLVGVSDVGPDGTRRPEVVTALPTVGNGGLELNDDGTMTIRYEIIPEAAWADGTPISGDDFAFTYETMRDLDPVAERFGADAELYDRILPESVLATDKTFQFTMEAPSIQHELLFPVLLPHHAVQGTDVRADWNDWPWVSGGPFVLETWERGVSMTFVRNDNYWRTDEDGVALPYLDSVEFRFIPDATRLVDAFRVADVEVATPTAAVTVIDALTELTESGVAVYALPGPIWEQIAFQFGERNRNPGSLNADVRFRRAVAYAVDTNTIADELLGGYGAALTSYVEAYRPGASEGAWSAYPYDPAEARRLIGEVCGDEGLPCEIDPPTVVLSTTADAGTRVRLAELLAPMLADAGIAVRLELEDGALLFGETLTAGTWDVGVWAWEAGPGLAPLVRVHDLWDPEGSPPYGTNYQRWGTAAVEGSEPVTTSSGVVELDQGPSLVIDQHTDRFAILRDRMQGLVDEQALLSLVAEAESLLADQVVFVPLFARLWVGAVWVDRVGGYVPNPVRDTWNIERWYRVDLAVDSGQLEPSGD